MNCHTSPTALEELFYTLSDKSQNLRTLALVKMKMNFPLDILAKLTKSPMLQDLDISGNDCKPLHFVPLLHALSKNRTLHVINMSWNSILDRNDQILHSREP